MGVSNLGDPDWPDGLPLSGTDPEVSAALDAVGATEKARDRAHARWRRQPRLPLEEWPASLKAAHQAFDQACRALGAAPSRTVAGAAAKLRHYRERVPLDASGPDVNEAILLGAINDICGIAER